VPLSGDAFRLVLLNEVLEGGEEIEVALCKEIIVTRLCDGNEGFLF